MKVGTRPVLIRAANLSDDLWLGVICQSKAGIAGSLRNIYRYSVRLRIMGVELLDECLRRKPRHLTKLRIPLFLPGSQSDRDKLAGREGKIPDSQLRPLNLC